MVVWTFESAKAKLSEVFRSAQVDGPQHVTVRGKPTAVIMSTTDYDRLKPNPSAETWVDRLRAAAGEGFDIDIEREADDCRPPFAL